MLDAFIIDEIRRREQEAERRREEQRPRKELPLPQRIPVNPEDEEPSSDRHDHRLQHRQLRLIWSAAHHHGQPAFHGARRFALREHASQRRDSACAHRKTFARVLGIHAPEGDDRR